MNYPFLKKVKDEATETEKIIFSGKQCEMFIPKYFFEDGFANIAGNTCSSIGIFWFRVDGKFYELQLPVFITFSYSDIISKKGFKLAPKIPAMDFDVIVLNNNDVFMDNAKIEILVSNILLFFNKLIEGAKLPPYVDYNAVLPLLMKALNATGTGSLGVSSVTYEFLLSELYRNKNSLSEPFRLAFNGKNALDYKMIRITKVPEYISTFASVTGEDITTQLRNSVIRSKENGRDAESALEILLKL